MAARHGTSDRPQGRRGVKDVGVAGDESDYGDDADDEDPLVAASSTAATARDARVFSPLTASSNLTSSSSPSTFGASTSIFETGGGRLRTSSTHPEP